MVEAEVDGLLREGVVGEAGVGAVTVCTCDGKLQQGLCYILSSMQVSGITLYHCIVLTLIATQRCRF